MCAAASCRRPRLCLCTLLFWLQEPPEDKLHATLTQLLKEAAASIGKAVRGSWQAWRSDGRDTAWRQHALQQHPPMQIQGRGPSGKHGRSTQCIYTCCQCHCSCVKARPPPRRSLPSSPCAGHARADCSGPAAARHAAHPHGPAAAGPHSMRQDGGPHCAAAGAEPPGRCRGRLTRHLHRHLPKGAPGRGRPQRSHHHATAVRKPETLCCLCKPCS